MLEIKGGERADDLDATGNRFDVRGLGGQPKDEDTEGMLASVGIINELISAEEQAGIPSERVVVGGFSQGESSVKGV